MRLIRRIVVLTGVGVAALVVSSYPARAQEPGPAEAAPSTRAPAAEVLAPPDRNAMTCCVPDLLSFAPTSSARVQVTPKETEVYLDGRFVGKVDEFDGFSQRLHVAAGGHELLLYLDGYKSVREKLLFEPGKTYKIKGKMERVGPGETSGPRPEPPAPAATAPAPVPPEGERPAPPMPPASRAPDRKSTRLNSSHSRASRMPSSA